MPLVELYTSEGCDSCPPADRWLRESFPPGGAQPAAAVLAFHVDYWDRLGWTDRFAKPAFTERQYAAATAGGSRTVYTPQILVQGRDAGLWRNGAVNRAVQSAAAAAPPVRIVLTAQPTEGAVTVNVQAMAAEGSTKDVELRVALTESDLVSSVTAGENRGVRLEHDHVVRVLSRGVAFGPDRIATETFRLDFAKERGRHPTVVGFAQDRRTGRVLESVVLPLCNGM
ncbi:MAG: DUF1223 domain-containing protein [Casimicrobiaceae bacterium]